MEQIQIKRFGQDGTWHARFVDGMNPGEWLPTPYFGPATFEYVRDQLAARNPDAEVSAA